MGQKHIRLSFGGFKLAAVLLLIVALAACASVTFTRDAYRALAAAGSTYDMAMKSAGSLYKEGKIHDQQKAQIISVAGKYRLAYFTAIDALAAYEKNRTGTTKTNAEMAILSYQDALADLVKLINEFL